MRAHLPSAVLGLGALVLALPTVASAAPSIASFTATPIVEVGERTIVKGRVAPGAATTVYIERRRANYTWARLAVVRSDRRGRFLARLPLRRSMRLRATIKVDGKLVAGPQRRNAAVRRRATVTVAVDRREAIAGRPVAVAGRVWPARPGERVLVQGRRGKRTIALGRLTVRVGGRVAGRVRAPGGGTWRIQLVAKGRRGVDRTGVARSRPLSFFARNPHGVSRGASHYIVQDLSERRLYYYENGALRRVHDVVFGKPSTPTPLGRYRVYSKTNGPGPAFGPKALWYHRGYGIHGTNQEHLLKQLFRYYSLGCTRNTNENILWLWPRVPVGTPVLNIA